MTTSPILTAPSLFDFLRFQPLLVRTPQSACISTVLGPSCLACSFSRGNESTSVHIIVKSSTPFLFRSLSNIAPQVLELPATIVASSWVLRGTVNLSVFNFVNFCLPYRVRVAILTPVLSSFSHVVWSASFNYLILPFETIYKFS